MKLRKQLMLAGALTLVLPLVAYRAIHQMDHSLRQSRSEDLLQRLNSTRAVLEFSNVLSDLQSSTTSVPGRALYGELLHHKIFLDGYPDDWINLKYPPHQFSYTDNKKPPVKGKLHGSSDLTVQLAVSRQHLFLFLAIPEDQVVFHDPSSGLLASGDYIQLYTGSSPGSVDGRVFRAIAPGSLTAYQFGQRFEGLQPIIPVKEEQGVWVSEHNGFQLEIRLPMERLGERIGIAMVDRDRVGGFSRLNWTGTHEPEGLPAVEDLWSLVLPSFEIVDLLREVVPAGSKASVFDNTGRLRGEVNRLYEKPANLGHIDPVEASFLNAMLFRFFEWLIREQQADGLKPFTSETHFQLDPSLLHGPSNLGIRNYTTLQNDQVIGGLASIHTGDDEADRVWILFETSEENTNAFTSSAMVRLFSLVTLVSFLVAAILLIFATSITLRIKRLSQDARAAVTGDGRFARSVVGSHARDEIGDLSRDFASLIERSAGYTHYLESLAAKLSHELRTPLTVVQTSLENLIGEKGSYSSDDRNEPLYRERLLLERALTGSDQMNRLVKAMSEAARLEQSVKYAEFRQLELVTWLHNLLSLYRDLYPEYIFELAKLPESLWVSAVPELLQQAFDKLVSNAADFTEHGGCITLTMDCQNSSDVDGSAIVFSVINRGSNISETLMPRLFEPMVSERTQSSSSVPHLGLGLYVVKLIAQAHGGQVFARNGNAAALLGFSIKTDEIISQ